MALSSDQVNIIIRAGTGVRGYLDFQDGLNNQLMDAAKPVLQYAPAGFDLALLGTLHAAKYAVAAELKVRETQRLAVAGSITNDQVLTGPDVPYNADAQASATQALGLLRKAQASITAEHLTQLQGAQRNPASAAAVAKARAALVQRLAKYNMDAQDLAQVLGIWDAHTQVVAETGVEGLLTKIDGSLQDFLTHRANSERGTQRGSLPWWKQDVIIGSVGIGIGLVIWCFLFVDCIFIIQIIDAYAPWLHALIDWGC